MRCISRCGSRVVYILLCRYSIMSRTTSKISKLTSKCAPLPSRAPPLPRPTATRAEKTLLVSVRQWQDVAGRSICVGCGGSDARARRGSGARSK